MRFTPALLTWMGRKEGRLPRQNPRRNRRVLRVGGWVGGWVEEKRREEWVALYERSGGSFVLLLECMFWRGGGGGE